MATITIVDFIYRTNPDYTPDNGEPEMLPPERVETVVEVPDETPAPSISTIKAKLDEIAALVNALE